MICSYLFFFSLFLFNINFVSSTVYSCNHNAECGCSKNDVVIDKIVGGESAASSSWGWAVSLQRDGSHFCGGSIISPLHIITAAHCVPNPTTVIGIVNVVASIDKLSESSSSKAQVRFITNVFSHPNYNDTSKVNDIAVLRLDEPLYISYDVGTARLCIPRTVSTNIRDDYPIPGSSLVAIGWGTLASGDISIPDNLHLQQVTLNAMSANHQMCIPTINNQQVQFCAAVIGGGKDTCQGDSGGPLMHFESDKRQWVLAGITSYGVGCGLPNYAGVYTRASVYNDWLRSIVNDNFVELTIDENVTKPPINHNCTSSPVNGASSVLINSLQSILSPYWSFALSLYTFARR
ncbi:unnamed protein product [Rotaria sp. Silwood1]|nr:unnamed protein product [Rotaria sp. Silwood1]CAF3390805.1 unnamed protein product [Rotaria sp. Silwood1]CAF4518976.1 unnamed protein product [Rotaria sp. Silwood1]